MAQELVTSSLSTTSSSSSLTMSSMILTIAQKNMVISATMDQLTLEHMHYTSKTEKKHTHTLSKVCACVCIYAAHACIYAHVLYPFTCVVCMRVFVCTNKVYVMIYDLPLLEQLGVGAVPTCCPKTL